MTIATKHKHSAECGCGIQTNAVIRGRRDPTRTLTLRNAFAADMARRFRELRGVIRRAIVDEDVFGLRDPDTSRILTFQGVMRTPGYKAFAFPRSQDKVTAFMDWLNTQVDLGILEVSRFQQLGTAVEKAWTNTYIQQSYQRGVQRGRQELIKAQYDVPSIQESGGIGVAMGGPMHLDTVGLMYTRTFSDLKGVTAAMDTQISRILSQGIAEGVSPIELARRLTRTISGPSTLAIRDTLGRYIPAERRAKMIARTETIRAHHMATIQEYKNYEVAGVKVLAEWATAGFDVCPECLDLEGEVFELRTIESMIPLHPNCRCVALPLPPRIAEERGLV